MAAVRWVGVLLVGAVVWVAVGLCGGSSATAATVVLTPVPGSPFSVGTSPGWVAFSPSGRVLAVLGGNSVSVFWVNSSTGALTPVPRSPFAAGENPQSVAFSPSGGLLAVASSADNTVSVLSVDPAGALTPVAGSPFAVTGPGLLGPQPDSVAFSPSGGLLATANGESDTVSVFSVNSSTGALAQVTGSPFATLPYTFPGSVAFSPSGGLLATANALGPDSVSTFSVNSSTGALTLVAGGSIASAYPDSLAFSPSGGQLAVATADNTVSVVSVNSDGTWGSLFGPTAIGTFGQTPRQIHSIAFSPSGGLLAVTNSGANTVSLLSVIPDGVPTEVGGSPFPTGAGPLSVAFSRSGGLLATANAGSRSVSVFSISYTNARAPSARITSPSNVATYTRGQLVDASFGCHEGAGGPGLASCAGTVPNGTPIDTATLGQHTFTVTGTSRDGLHTTSTVTYTVIEPGNQITVSHIKTHADGTISFQTRVPGPGRLDVVETAWYDTRAHRASVARPVAHLFASGRAHTIATRAGVLHLRVSLSAKDKGLVRKRSNAFVLTFSVTYTPTGGIRSSVDFYGLHLGRGCPDAVSSRDHTKTNCAP